MLSVGRTFFKLLSSTAKLGTGIGVVAGAAMAPSAAIKACENSLSTESRTDIAKKATIAAGRTMLATTTIGFYVGTAPVSIPARYAYEQYQNKMKPS